LTEATEIEIIVNGESHYLAAHQSVADLITQTGRDPGAVAVERNGRVLPRDEYEGTKLQSGDSLEVVQLVQGG
jgi:sulfur carrier protein